MPKKRRIETVYVNEIVYIFDAGLPGEKRVTLNVMRPAATDADLTGITIDPSGAPGAETDPIFTAWWAANGTDITSAISLKHSNATDHAPGSDNQDLSGLVVKVTGSSLVPDTEIAKIHASGSDNQDLSGLVVKVSGSSLVPDTEITKLAGVEAGANNYTHPANHAPSIITQDASNRFVTDAEKSGWNGKEPGNANIQAHVGSAHAPSNAQKNSDILKTEIEGVLTGEISSHTHPGGSGGLTHPQVMARTLGG